MKGQLNGEEVLDAGAEGRVGVGQGDEPSGEAAGVGHKRVQFAELGLLPAELLSVLE